MNIVAALDDPAAWGLERQHSLPKLDISCRGCSG